MMEELYMQEYEELCDVHINEITHIFTRLGCEMGFVMLDGTKLLQVIPKFGYSKCHTCNETIIADENHEH